MKNFFIKLFILCFLSIGFVLNSGQAATAISEISPDSDTAFLEHFNGSNSAEYTAGEINYVDSLPGLDKAGDFSQGWASFRFDGGNQFPYSYDFISADKKGTIEIWIYPLQNNSYNFFNINYYLYETTPKYGNILSLGFNNEGKIIANIVSSTSPVSSLIPLPAGSTTIPLNKWTRVALTWSRESGTALYVDGKLDASSKSDLYPAFYGYNYINIPGWEARNIYIDEVVISRAASTGFDADDSILPVTNALLSGTPGNDGWYRSDVQVTLNAADNDGSGGVDKFGIRIWDTSSEVIVYDSQLGAEDGAETLTVLGGGSIVIHKD